MKWSSCLGLVLVFAAAIGLAGCGFSGPTVSGDIPSIFSKQQAEKQKTDVDVYWDATYSMQGYTTIPEGNVYRSLPDNLEDIGNSMGQVKFFRFGETVQPLEGRDHRKFSDPSAYNETITAIHTVLDTADTSHLSVIVTDLFESDADWSNVAQKVKEKYFANHLGAAVIGIKNPFNGDIFDVGFSGEAKKFNYNSGNDPARYRPFYLLVLGQEDQVRDFIQRCKAKKSGDNDMRFLLLSENLMDNPADLSSMEIKDSKNIFGDEKLKLKDKRMKEFGIDKVGEPAHLVTSFQYKPAEDGCNVDVHKLAPKVEVKVLKGGEWQKPEADGDCKLTIEPDPAQAGMFTMDLSFTPEKSLDSGQVNLVYATVAPGPEGISLPDWVKQWNMENVSGMTAQQFDGSKTINFSHLVESLKDSALSAAQPIMANMALVISYE